MKVYQKRDKYLLVILAIIAIVASAYLYVQTRPDRNEQVSQQISKPTVKVMVAFADGSKGNGTGIIVKHYQRVHFVLTCWHVACNNTPSLVIATHNGKVFEARVFYHDQKKDLALIYFIANTEYPVATIVEQAPPLTSKVYLHGYGENWPVLYTGGIFSGKKSLWESHPNAWVANIHVWPGYSGCGVYNTEGELFGVAALMMISRKFIDRLPWLCGFVPLPDIQNFLRNAGVMEAGEDK